MNVKMNKKQLFITFGLSTLGIALVALPGASARRQDQQPSASTHAQSKAQALKTQVHALPACEQEPQVQAFTCGGDEEGLAQDNVRVGVGSALASIADDEDDMQVVLGPGIRWCGG